MFSEVLNFCGYEGVEPYKTPDYKEAYEISAEVSRKLEQKLDIIKSLFQAKTNLEKELTYLLK